MGISIAGKIAFITGASAGIGKATALALAAAGAKLLLCARTTDALEAMRQDLLSAGAAGVHSFALDVSKRDDVANAFASLPAEWQAIEILVNNAGLARGLEKLYLDDIDHWEQMIDTNTKGLLYITRAVLPGMVQRNAGHVVNMGSTAGWLAYAGGAVYCATKAAEKILSEGMRIDLMGTAVRVTSVDPGMVETRFSEVRFGGDKKRAAKVYANVTPLLPEDVADTILWAVTRPAHVNVSSVLLTPIDQANAVTINRRAS
ncbi:short-chain alcohol dehydrogenase [Terriglobus roseus DSM 18391]|uniref:Short-chain alcohol dehydrogenase n=1 Tax=Terriglobus roseus (strain DSM 18391 / NRRL B-41598 / KBS 63) TaxID=926566 RepID=I3ZDE8_TERRK|nr:SDR family NAD(P)-dependent oxidoreductase [Terriglobus roseus]AFL87266.1 short-chain alcohol dehydrogenase [Terriglobus roseus DSM 18391]